MTVVQCLTIIMTRGCLVTCNGERRRTTNLLCLTNTEKKYSQLDKEVLAEVISIGRHFELKTDYTPLTHIFSETKATPNNGRTDSEALILGPIPSATSPGRRTQMRMPN